MMVINNRSTLIKNNITYELYTTHMLTTLKHKDNNTPRIFGM